MKLLNSINNLELNGTLTHLIKGGEELEFTKVEPLMKSCDETVSIYVSNKTMVAHLTINHAEFTLEDFKALMVLLKLEQERVMNNLFEDLDTYCCGKQLGFAN